MAFRLNSRSSLLAAAILLVAAGIGAIYGIGGGNGNAPDAVCAGALQKAKELSPLLRQEMAAVRIMNAPMPLGELAFLDADGKPRTLGESAGKTVLLNLWATWCPPCRAEMPALDALQRELGGEKFEVVAISVDLGAPDKPKRFFAETGISSLGFFHDGSMDAFNRLKKAGLAIGMPVSVLIDRDGCALAVLNGPAQWDSPAAKALIKAASR
jgi:thiol-disulfide isomerase/thioredoxin